jgi:2-amino-4-hydroxy-6-hydroxymethyldihydropteridine diphosphokinase
MLIKRIIFGLGSNLGDKESYLNQAVKKLEEKLFLTDIKKSKILKNPALLLPNSPNEWNQEFFNIAVSSNVDLEKFSPEKILEIIGDIEKDLGRKESERWAPREIDIDILTIEELVINIGNKLIVPHYDLLNRDFFLQTIKEIEPDWKYPS